MWRGISWQRGQRNRALVRISILIFADILGPKCSCDREIYDYFICVVLILLIQLWFNSQTYLVPLMNFLLLFMYLRIIYNPNSPKIKEMENSK